MLIILVLGALPVITAALVSSFSEDGGGPPHEWDDALLNGFYASSILPLIVLAVATAAFANEIEDKTLSNLTLNPIARWQIVLPKLLACILVSAPVLLVSAAIASFIGYDGDMRTILAVAVALLAGVAAYSSAFLWAGLMTGRALGYGLLYVFLWEGLFSSFVEGIRFFSIREYMIGLMHGLDSSRFSGPDDDPLSFGVAIAGSAIVITLFFLLGVRRLRTMDVP